MKNEGRARGKETTWRNQERRNRKPDRLVKVQYSGHENVWITIEVLFNKWQTPQQPVRRVQRGLLRYLRNLRLTTTTFATHSWQKIRNYDTCTLLIGTKAQYPLYQTDCFLTSVQVLPPCNPTQEFWSSLTPIWWIHFHFFEWVVNPPASKNVPSIPLALQVLQALSSMWVLCSPT